MKKKINIFWFRRDLRLDDNAGLFHALNAGLPVLPIFIFDSNILDKLSSPLDKRVQFIHQSLTNIQKQLQAVNSSLHVLHHTPENAFNFLLDNYSIEHVYTNHDYESYGINRDKTIEALLADRGIGFHTFKDQVIFEKNDVLKDDGTPYTVFTPYSKKWKLTLQHQPIQVFDNKKYFSQFLQTEPLPFPTIESIGFCNSPVNYPSAAADTSIIQLYKEQRDIPGINSTSKMGIHLRFGTISIRQLALQSMSYSETYLNELIWRDFYHMIAWHFLRVQQQLSFKPAYDGIEWRNNEKEFEAWCNGQTGYPIVDAGMRELNETGFMHNRVRMITASFLCKHLLIDWRWGEAYFAEKLLDFDFAANNGGWQWAAGSGCDAAPYFRIFNPYLQTQKFDPHFTYIKKWVPEFQEFHYPKPIVIHEVARERCLACYAKALKN